MIISVCNPYKDNFCYMCDWIPDDDYYHWSYYYHNFVRYSFCLNACRAAWIAKYGTIPVEEQNYPLYFCYKCSKALGRVYYTHRHNGVVYQFCLMSHLDSWVAEHGKYASS